MGIVWDIVKEIPLSGVLKEKIVDLDAKIGALETENTILKGDLRKANQQIAYLQAENERFQQQMNAPSPTEDALDEKAVRILRAFTHHTDPIPDVYIREESGLTATEFSYYLQDLNDRGFLTASYAQRGGSIFYDLKQPGRKYLLDHPT